MSAIESICILRLSAIGDVCHALAVVQAIGRHYPEATITWVIGRVEAALFANVPNIHFVVFDKRDGLAAYKKLRQQLPQTFDVLLHMQVALRANMAAACIKAKRKIGFARHLSKELHGCVINERAPAPLRPHVLEGFAAFAHAIGVPEFVPQWNIPMNVADEAWAANLLPNTQPLLVVSPAASNPERNWLTERYAAVISHAQAQGFCVVLTGGPTSAEKTLASAIAQACPSPPLNWVGKSSLTQLLALLKRATVVLSPDSGPAHMATTQGTPVIGLYAHSNPARTGPYLSLSWVASVYPQQLLLQTGKACEQVAWGKRIKGAHLMAEISVEQVVQLFDALVANMRIKEGSVNEK